MTDDDKAAALESKRKRLEAWRKRQGETTKSESAKPKPKISLSLSVGVKKRKKTKRPLGFGGFDDGDDNHEEKKSIDFLDMSMSMNIGKDDVPQGAEGSSLPPPAKKKRRWGASESAPLDANKSFTNGAKDQEDDLDKFMDDLNAGAMGKVVVQQTKEDVLSIDVSGSMLRHVAMPGAGASNSATPISGGVITPEELAKLTGEKEKGKPGRKEDGAYYGPSDWDTSASEVSFHDLFD